MADDPLRRTIVIRLLTSNEADEHLLEHLFDEFQHGVQTASDIGWNTNTTDPYDLQDIAEDAVAEHTALKSQHCILACHRAAHTLDAMDELQAQGEQSVSKPEFTAPTAVLDPNTLTVFEDKDKVSITVPGDYSRVHADLDLPNDSENHQRGYIEDDAWKLAESTLHARDGEYWLHLGYKQPAPDELSAADNDTVIGVDLNVTGPFAATSTGEFIGSADDLNHWRDEYEQRRGALQQAGTRSAHLTMQSLGSRFADWSVERLHKRANALVAHAVDEGADGLVFEELAGILDRISDGKKFQQWAYAEFIRIVTYKARAEGVWVKTVPAAYTSLECSRCGYVADANRNDKEFACVHCEREVHSDYDGAVMIGKKFLRLRASQTRSGGGASCQLALKSGTVPVDATAVSLVAWDQYTDKPHPQRASGRESRAK